MVVQNLEVGSGTCSDPPPLEWSILKYGLRAEGGSLWVRRDTPPKRSLRSCAKSISWLRREPRWRTRSARLGSPRSVVIESWRRHDNSVRPHASLGYRPPAPEVVVPAFAAWPAALTRPAPPTRLSVAPRPTLN